MKADLSGVKWIRFVPKNPEGYDWHWALPNWYQTIWMRKILANDHRKPVCLLLVNDWIILRFCQTWCSSGYPSGN